MSRRRGWRLRDGRGRGRRMLRRLRDMGNGRRPVRPEIGQVAGDDQRAERGPQPAPDAGLVRCGRARRRGARPSPRRPFGRLREKSRDRRGDTGGNGSARRQKANDLRHGVSERGRKGAVRQAEAALNPAQHGRAERPLDLPSREWARVRATKPRCDFRGQPSLFEHAEEPGQPPRRARDHRQDLFDERSGVGAEPVASGQVVDQRVECRHVSLPEGSVR